jgi:hypothetical protein
MVSSSASLVVTPGRKLPYAVVFKRGEAVISSHSVATVAEGEALMRRVLPTLDPFRKPELVEDG